MAASRGSGRLLLLSSRCGLLHGAASLLLTTGVSGGIQRRLPFACRDLLDSRVVVVRVPAAVRPDRRAGLLR